MTKLSRAIAGALTLVAILAISSGIALAQNAERNSGVPVANQQAIQLQATADKAATSIQASATETQAITAAVKAQNLQQAKTILLKNGFTAKQLEGVQIVLADKTGPKAGAKIKVTITVSGPPWKITITISW